MNRDARTARLFWKMRFECEQWLPASRDEVFRFFSDAANLQAITPPWLHFTVMTPRPIRIRQGSRIDYRLRLHGLPLRWQSEITAWDPPVRFVDEQRRGPYRRWIHTHSFVVEGDGTSVRDSVEFDVPFSRVSAWFVRRDLRKIFAYRRRVLAGVFAR
jgi:ligand-binding SRPBCC domain-containing protein